VIKCDVRATVTRGKDSGTPGRSCLKQPGNTGLKSPATSRLKQAAPGPMFKLKDAERTTRLGETETAAMEDARKMAEEVATKKLAQEALAKKAETEEAAKEEAAEKETAKEEAAKEEAAKEEAAKEEAAKEESAKEEAAKEEAAKEVAKQLQITQTAQAAQAAEGAAKEALQEAAAEGMEPSPMKEETMYEAEEDVLAWAKAAEEAAEAAANKAVAKRLEDEAAAEKEAIEAATAAAKVVDEERAARWSTQSTLGEVSAAEAFLCGVQTVQPLKMEFNFGAGLPPLNTREPKRFEGLDLLGPEHGGKGEPAPLQSDAAPSAAPPAPSSGGSFDDWIAQQRQGLTGLAEAISRISTSGEAQPSPTVPGTQMAAADHTDKGDIPPAESWESWEKSQKDEMMQMQQNLAERIIGSTSA